MPLTKNRKKNKEENTDKEAQVETEVNEATESETTYTTNKTGPATKTKSELRVARATLQSISKNHVKLTGVVMSTYSPSKDIFIVNLATNANGSSASDYPSVTFFNKLANKVRDMLEHAGKFPKVTITGHIQTDKKVRRDGIKYFQNITGMTFDFTQTALEKALNVNAGRVMANDENEVALLGELVSLYIINPNTNSSRTRLTVKTDTGRYAFVETTIFSLPKSILSKLEKGQIVAVYGSVQTRKRNRNGITEHSETIVGREVIPVV
jgi:single-stranded DNA-binding protein